MSSNINYKLEFSRRAERDFSKLDKPTQRFIWEKLSTLEKSKDPLRNSAKLVNFNNYYRHRFGDYRVIFTLEKNGKIAILLILRIGHRKEIYNQLS
jgi:mRNA interferase RelE/StbE